MKSFKFFILLIAILCSGVAYAQTSLSGKVLNPKTRQPIDYVVVQVADQDVWAVTNSNGEFFIKSVRPGKLTLVFSCLGYEKRTVEYVDVSAVTANTVFYLREDNLSLKEVVVTAQKQKNELSTSYVIDRNAINHMQATTVEDVLAQLPGGQTNPTVRITGDAQRLALRSQSVSENDNSSFGTAIEINGVRLSNNGNFTDGNLTAVDLSNRLYGVDTRNIGIHNIESVEVTTGLPSVEHGDLSAGLISITTKKGKTPWEIEIVRKPYISSYSISKGFQLGAKSGTLNASYEYARAIADRASPYTTYVRNDLNLDYHNSFGSKEHPIDFTYSFAGNVGGYNSEADPDAMKNTYTKQKDNALRNSLNAKWLINASWITSLEVQASMNYTDRKKEIKTNPSSSSAQPSIHTLTEGYYLSTPYTENPNANVILVPSGQWYEYEYTDEKPVNYSLEMKAKWSREFGKVRSNFLLGGQWNSAGNYGKGLSYGDYSLAPTYREYRYDQQPFVNNIAAFAEEKVTFPLFGHDLQLQGGIRSDITTIKGSEYGTVAGFSPRINAKYRLIDNNQGTIKQLSFHGGWGDAVKLPSSGILFPTPSYTDIAVFSASTGTNTGVYGYYSYPQKTIYNADLKWQRNRKAELGIDLKLAIADISLSGYFDRTLNPYRSSATYSTITYKKSAISSTTTDANYWAASMANTTVAIDPTTGAVTLYDKTGVNGSKTLTSTAYAAAKRNEFITNGSPTAKRGVEWVVDFKEISAIRTGIRVDGAYSYYKGVDETLIPQLGSSGTMSDGTTPYKFIGYYVGGNSLWNGFKSKKLTTNVTFTTHIPALRLIFSLRVEASLYDNTQYLTEYSDGNRSFVIDSKNDYFASTSGAGIYSGNQYVGMYPLYYVSIDDMNTKIPFAEKFAWAKTNDPTLYNELAKMVIKSNYDYQFNKISYDPYFIANLNVTKEIGNNVSITFLANNFFNSTMQVKNSQTGNNVSLYKSAKVSPLYYGLSLRVKL